MKYEVISLHPFTECNMKPRCDFCYRPKCDVKGKPRKFFLDMVEYIAKLTPQIAVGGGEPLMDIPFIKDMSEECKKHKVMMNITSNGYLLQDMNDEELKDVLKNITMISLSFDAYKRGTKKKFEEYAKLVDRIHKLTKAQVGCNLLIDKNMFKNDGKTFLALCVLMFNKVKVDRIFALTPKNMPCPDILKYKKLYMALTEKFKHFYVDDLGKMIISEGKYSDWKHPCHYGKGLISINESGIVHGCSFDAEGYQLEEPKDVMKDFEFGERFSCPYLKK